MNLRDLQYLVAVAEHRHFGKAAEACYVSQPTLSTQLKKLEQELGVDLIERNAFWRGQVRNRHRQTLRGRWAARASERERDDERAGALDEFATGGCEWNGHHGSPYAAARLTARKMAAWVPQRHRLGRIC